MSEQIPKQLLQVFRQSRKLQLLALLMVLALGMILALPSLVNINRYRAQIVSQLELRLGRKVSLGVMQLRLWPLLNINVADVTIGDDPAFADGNFVMAKGVRLQLGWGSLLRGNPQVAGIELVAPEVHLIKSSSKQWNWSSLKPLQTQTTGSDAAPFDLKVTNGKVRLTDRTVNPESNKSLEGVQLQLKAFSTAKPFEFVLALSLPGAKAGSLAVDGTAGPLNGPTKAVKARLKLQQVEIADLSALAGISSPAAGKLTLQAEVERNAADGFMITGNGQADQWSLVEGVAPVATPLSAQYRFSFKPGTELNGGTTPALLQIENAVITLGKTALTVAGQINQVAEQTKYDLKLKGEGIALDSLLESAYALGIGPPAGTRAQGIAGVDLQATGNGQTIALQGQANIAQLQFQHPQMPQAIQISALQLRCEPELITAAPFRSTLSQTAVAFNNFSVSHYGNLAQTPNVHGEISTTNAQLEDLLRIAESFGARQAVNGSGLVSLTAGFDKTAGGLRVNGQGKLDKVRLQTSGLKQPLEISHADLQFTGDSARINNLQARLANSEVTGWVQVQSLANETATFDLRSNQINVAEVQQALNSADNATGAKNRNSWKASGKLSVGKLQLESLTATAVNSTFSMQNQQMRLAPVSLQAFGGSYQGSLNIDNAQSPPALSVQGRFAKMDINQLLSQGGDRSMIYGQADGSVDLRGRGSAGVKVAETLTGNSSIVINNGKFTSFDLMRQVEMLGKFANLPTKGAGTAFRLLKTNLRFDQGRLTMDALQITMEDSQINGDGAMQLGASPTINYDLLVRLSPALSKRLLPASAEKRGGFGLPTSINSVVGNFFVEQGAIAIPIKVSGTLQQPSFGLNSALLQKRLTEQVKSGVKEGLLDQLKKVTGSKSAENNQPEATQPEQPNAKPSPTPVKPADLLKGVLDKLRKKGNP